MIDLGSFVIACDICDTYRTQTLPGKLLMTGRSAERVSILTSLY